VTEVILAGMAEPIASTKRRGRPIDRDSNDTRRAIIDSARCLFAERGYGAVTNKEVAAAAGITPAALYHYVDSKLDLYVAVHRDLQRQVYRSFVDAVAAQSTFVGQFEAVLEAAHDLNERDPSLAMFIGTVRIDMRRFPEIQGCLSSSVAGRDEFFTSIVDAGIATGEVAAERRETVVEFIRVMFVGLTEGTTRSSTEHRLAVDAMRAAIRGDLLGSTS
jgi:AcrR family transcriptional regulator